MSERTSFAEQLAELNRSLCEGMPAPQVAVLRRAVAELRKTGIVQRALQLGETVPDFPFPADGGELRKTSLYALLTRGPVVINFFRGFWCRFCKSEFEAYEAILDELAQMGAHYVAVSPHHASDQDLGDVTCRLVTDHDNCIARSYGIVYELGPAEQSLFSDLGIPLDEANDCCNWELPLPATYLIDQERKVCFQYVDADFRQRLSPAELLDALRRYQGG